MLPWLESLATTQLISFQLVKFTVQSNFASVKSSHRKTWLESTWVRISDLICLPFWIEPSQSHLKCDSSQVESFCLSDLSQVKSQKKRSKWLELTRVKSNHSALLTRAKSSHKNVTWVDSSQRVKTSHSAFLTQAKSSHKNATRVKSNHSAFPTQA